MSPPGRLCAPAGRGAGSKRGDDRRNHARLAATAIWLVLLAATDWSTCKAASAEIPIASREFRTERYIGSPDDLRDMQRRRIVALALSGGILQQSEKAGEWDPFGSWKRIGGGRAVLSMTIGRFSVGGEGLADTPGRVEGDEFEQRIHATVYMPELRMSLTGAAGFEDGYRGADVSAEVLAGRPVVPSDRIDLIPRVWAWLRARKLDDESKPLLRSVLGLFLQHGPALASSAYAGASVRTDFGEGLRPRSDAMLQIGFATTPRPLWGPEDPGPFDDPGPPIARNLFFTLAYAMPLDARVSGRIVAQTGIRLVTGR